MKIQFSHFVASVAALLLSLSSPAQTITTKAKGVWCNLHTVVLGAALPIIEGKSVVNIKHKVTANLTDNVLSDGALNINSDTLHFSTALTKRTTILTVDDLGMLNGEFTQNILSNKYKATIKTGRVQLENHLLLISNYLKNYDGS